MSRCPYGCASRGTIVYSKESAKDPDVVKRSQELGKAMFGYDGHGQRIFMPGVPVPKDRPRYIGIPEKPVVPDVEPDMVAIEAALERERAYARELQRRRRLAQAKEKAEKPAEK